MDYALVVVGSRWRGANTALGLNVLQLPGVLERRLPHTHRAWLTVEYAEE